MTGGEISGIADVGLMGLSGGRFALAFGIVFDLPLAITLGTRLGLVTPEVRARNRKYAILDHVIIAAVLTPIPDAFNQVLIAGPLGGRCELVMLGAWIFR